MRGADGAGESRPSQPFSSDSMPAKLRDRRRDVSGFSLSGTTWTGVSTVEPSGSSRRVNRLPAYLLPSAMRPFRSAILRSLNESAIDFMAVHILLWDEPTFPPPILPHSDLQAQSIPRDFDSVRGEESL